MTSKHVDATKACPRCKLDKPLTDYNTQAKSVDGLQFMCRECQRVDKRFRRYGVTAGWYDKTLEAQGMSCAVCRIHISDYTRSRYFDVDHDHNTGKPRGLLCNRCNMVLGQIDDDRRLLNALNTYLKRYKI